MVSHEKTAVGSDARKTAMFREKLLESGFDEVRFAEAGPVPHGRAEEYREWVESGMHADMEWIPRSLEKRLSLEKVLPGVRSIILLGTNYWPGSESAANQDRWAKYALYSDYHDTIKPALVKAGKLLEEGFGVSSEDYRYYTDTGPVTERGWAVRSGMGFQGKNGMLISRVHGNWLFLSVILTRHRFDPDAPLAEALRKSGRGRLHDTGLLCGKCTRCIDACPTKAIPKPGVVDARLCISYQTIENRKAIPRELRPSIGGHLFGCDLCLDVCPWNRFAKRGRLVLLSARYDLADLTLEEILSMSREEFSKVFARTPVKRLKWQGLLRNACVVAGNLSGPQDRVERLLPLLEILAGHNDRYVRQHAVWACGRLAGAERARRLLRKRHAEETESEVLEEYLLLGK